MQATVKKTSAQAVTSTTTTTTTATPTKKKKPELKLQAINKVVLTAKNTYTITTIDGKTARDEFNKALNSNVAARVESLQQNSIL